MRAEPVSALWLALPAGRTGLFTACCLSRAPHCAAAAGPTILRVGASPPGRNVTAKSRPLIRSGVSPLAGCASGFLPGIVAAHRLLHEVEYGGQPPRILAGSQPGHQAVEDQF